MPEKDAAVVEEIDEVEEVDADLVDADDADPDDTDDEDGATEEDDSESAESSTAKKDDSFQTRIDELTGKYRSEERARTEAETRYQQTLRQLQEMQQARPIDPDKSLADFDYDEKSYASYLTDVARQSAQQEIQQRLYQERTTERHLQFTARESDFGSKVDDYQSVTRNPALPITGPMIEALQTTEAGPAVLYYLGKNPDVARNLAGMPPLDMARELGRIEATKLSKPEKSTSKTPPPPSKIKAGAASTRIAPNSPESDKLSDKEWLSRERKRLAAKDK